METKTKPFDGSEYFEHIESQAYLLNDALATGEAGYIADALGTIARARGMTEIARLTGLSRGSLYAALDEKGNPGLDTLMKVLAALNLELRAAPKSDAA